MDLRSDTLTLSLTSRTALASPRPETLELRRDDRLIRLKHLDPGVVAALSRLAEGPATHAELEKIAQATHPGTDLRRLDTELLRLSSKLLLRFGCASAGTQLLTATIRTDLWSVDSTPPPPDTPLQLSRFAFVHRVGDLLVLESPASYARVEILLAELAGPILSLAQPRTTRQVCERTADCDPRAVAAAIGFLHSVGVVSRLDDAGRHPDDARPELVQRDIQDLVLHAASRRGLGDTTLGGTFRFLGVLPPPPARKPLPAGRRVALPRVDLDRLADNDPPLVRVMESRASVRAHGADPITLDQVSEFLYRVARVKASFGIDDAAGLFYETTKRPSPSGGAAHDLEFYLTVRTCAGLQPGFYHYDPFDHQLTEVGTREEFTAALLHDAYLASGGSVMPQVLITLACRFQRTSWKYEGMAYATTLKNVGVAYHAMYLAATAMGLAPCALGSGNSATFAAITGIDPVVESTVGEFMLGTRPGAPG
jgi:SagB-type dehydrogenase family enzyme